VKVKSRVVAPQGDLQMYPSALGETDSPSGRYQCSERFAGILSVLTMDRRKVFGCWKAHRSRARSGKCPLPGPPGWSRVSGL